ncbi:MAG: hypothetical protein JW925_12355 [Syntrophaceae bacterium]|nr:hypothetical protein [Syntrophaceae bacterium]
MAKMKRKDLEYIPPQSPIIFHCPQCRRILPGEFDVHTSCPYCGYSWGKYCRICMECRCLHLPVYRFCPTCGKKTIMVKNDKLLCKGIIVGKEYLEGYHFQMRFGWDFNLFEGKVEGAIEETTVNKTPAGKLPLLIGRIKTPAGTAALENRLKTGK